jgi:ubiquinone/menaquinone biosynthesis C-methylase UbiE
MELETLHTCSLCGCKQLEALDVDNNIHECVQCHYVFDNPRPTQREIVAFYSQPSKYDSWLAEEAARDALWRRRIRKLLRVTKPGSLLDVGTGTGQFLDHARKFYSAVYGTEVSGAAIRIAKQRYNLDLMEGQVDIIDFDDMRFDNITLFHVLEHVPNPRAVIEKCRDVLTGGGVLVIAVPNDLECVRPKLNRFLKRISGKPVESVGRLGLPRITLDGRLAEIHLSHFTASVLARFLERSGFCILENTLDPFYVAVGLKTVREKLFYGVCTMLRTVAGINLYDTIWLAARKV